MQMISSCNDHQVDCQRGNNNTTDTRSSFFTAISISPSYRRTSLTTKKRIPILRTTTVMALWFALSLLLKSTSVGASIAPTAPTTTASPTSSKSSTASNDPETTTMTSTTSTKKRLTLDTLAPGVLKMQYAVRGPVVQEADRIAEELASSPSDEKKRYPFDHIVYTNIGNPQSVGQPPLTFPRQVLALVDLPNEVGVDHPMASKMFPQDAIERAKEIKHGLVHGSGAYSHSQGALCFRQDVANFINSRDGNLVPTNPEHIFLTNGASAGIGMILTCLISNPKSGCLIPIPQYPIYSATIDLLQGHCVGYYLDEEQNWELNLQELERAYQDALEQGIDVNSMVLINPGNPTGQVLSKDNVKDIVSFCSKHNLVLLADEVYQDNVYDPNCEFVSAKRAAAELGLIQSDAIELVSFHSVSKGVFGECGRRGGYMELVGIDDNVRDMIYKLASSFLCSTVSGQIMVSLMVRGPQPGDASYESHQREMQTIFDSLKRRATLVEDGLNRIDGVKCRPAQGAMYCFPSVELPLGAIEEASKQQLSPDTLYAVSLLQSTGICVVPASGFGQRPGRFGFRTTFLPPEDEMGIAVEQMAQHHRDFWDKYSEK